jgi:hypothetical protein
MIPMITKTLVTEINQAIVTMASIGRKCARLLAVTAVTKVIERSGVHITLVTLVSIRLFNSVPPRHKHQGSLSDCGGR